MSIEILLFYGAAFVAVASTMLTVTRTHAPHALINLIVSLLAVAVIFFLLGAPFAAALEVVIYAGAIMVFFLFVVMMLNLGPSTREQERRWLQPRIWVVPGILTGLLLLAMIYLIAGSNVTTPGVAVPPKAVGVKLFGPYLLAVELASILLLAGLVGAYHLGRRYMRARREEIE